MVIDESSSFYKDSINVQWGMLILFPYSGIRLMKVRVFLKFWLKYQYGKNLEPFTVYLPSNEAQ